MPFVLLKQIKLKMNKLKIAIQKSGRLNEDSLKILKECGISVSNGLYQLKATVPNFPMEILFLLKHLSVLWENDWVRPGLHWGRQ